MSSSSDVLGDERPMTLNRFSAKHIVEKQSIPYDPQFEVNFTEDDPHSARCLPVWRKWVIVAVISTTSLCVACASSLYTGTTAQVENKFGTSRTITTLGLSMFVVGLGLGPMILAPLSEFYGRRPVYVISTLMFVIWIVPCAVANNIATLVVAHFLDGFAGAAFLSVAGGTVGDMFTGAELQKPMMVYTAAPFLGPEIGPLIADFINYKANCAFDLVFEHNHGFELWQVGLSFLGIMVGMIIGILSGPLWHKNYRRLVRHHEEMTGEVGGSEPEYRLPSAIVGAPLIVVGMLWFGWTQYSSIHWIVPIIGSSFFGCGVILVFSGVFTFLVDSYPNSAASALAANGFARSMFAAMFPLFGPAMYNDLGYQWATFLLTMLAAILAPCP
ncbi:hypothetical protein KCU99_g10092, partial [Aureobasidium melanogenum]